MQTTLRILATLCLCFAVIVSVGCDRTVTTVEQNVQPTFCFDCHSDQNTELVSIEQQYLRSVHASGNNIDRSNAPCSGCHISEGFVSRVTGEPIPDPSVVTAIHCFTCHAPHSSKSFNLRVTAPQTLEDGTVGDLGSANICLACHHARENVNTYVDAADSLGSSHWGPHHSVQSDILFSANGYRYTGYSYANSTSHRTATTNGCLHCHFNTTENYRLGGHSFNMVWEEDGQTSRNTDACQPCHNISSFDFSGVQTRTDTFADSLLTMLANIGLVDAEGHRISGATPPDIDTEGALWNWLLVTEDRSRGIHNPGFTLDLLDSSIQFLLGNLPQTTAQGGTTNQPTAARQTKETRADAR